MNITDIIELLYNSLGNGLVNNFALIVLIILLFRKDRRDCEDRK
jgi:hypothetical protein